MNIYAIIILAIIINIIIIYLIIRWYRNKLFAQYQNFLDKTDEILSGKKIDLSYDESLDSAISERLNRIMEISHMQKEIAEEERDIIKSLITNISHQIRTPLANITLYTGLLKERISDSKSTRLADKIENNAGTTISHVPRFCHILYFPLTVLFWERMRMYVQKASDSTSGARAAADASGSGLGKRCKCGGGRNLGQQSALAAEPGHRCSGVLRLR